MIRGAYWRVLNVAASAVLNENGVDPVSRAGRADDAGAEREADDDDVLPVLAGGVPGRRVVALRAGRPFLVEVDGERGSGVKAVGAGLAGRVAAHRGDQPDLVGGPAGQQVR